MQNAGMYEKSGFYGNSRVIRCGQKRCGPAESQSVKLAPRHFYGPIDDHPLCHTVSSPFDHGPLYLGSSLHRAGQPVRNAGANRTRSQPDTRDGSKPMIMNHVIIQVARIDCERRG